MINLLYNPGILNLFNPNTFEYLNPYFFILTEDIEGIFIGHVFSNTSIPVYLVLPVYLIFP